MGGAKKKSFSQTEKQQRLRSKKSEESKSSKRQIREKKSGGITIPQVSEQTLSSELAKMKAITPYTLATKYDLKLSIARSWLNILEQRGIIQRVSSGSLIVYSSV